MKKIRLIIGGTILFVVLMAAAFVGGRILTTSAGAAASSENEAALGLQFVGEDGKGPHYFRLKIEPAPELPDRPSDAAGVFVRREDNSIFVGTGDIEMQKKKVDDTTGQLSMSVHIMVLSLRLWLVQQPSFIEMRPNLV